MPESGETPVKKQYGSLIDQHQLEMLMIRHRAQAEPFCKLTIEGSKDEYTFAYLARCGIAMFSHQDGRVFVLELAEIAQMARAAGIDQARSLIILPGSEAARG